MLSKLRSVPGGTRLRNASAGGEVILVVVIFVVRRNAERFLQVACWIRRSIGLHQSMPKAIVAFSQGYTRCNVCVFIYETASRSYLLESARFCVKVGVILHTSLRMRKVLSSKAGRKKVRPRRVYAIKRLRKWSSRKLSSVTGGNKM